jgi:hypothetical protein
MEGLCRGTVIPFWRKPFFGPFLLESIGILYFFERFLALPFFLFVSLHIFHTASLKYIYKGCFGIFLYFKGSVLHALI